MILTLQEIKDHLKIDGHDQDAEIKRLYAAAEDYVLRYIELSQFVNPVPASLKQAILIMIGDLNENREAAVVGATRTDNKTIYRLLDMHRTPGM